MPSEYVYSDPRNGRWFFFVYGEKAEHEYIFAVNVFHFNWLDKMVVIDCYNGYGV